MTKRSVETVLRDELDDAMAAVTKAEARVAKARDAFVDANVDLSTATAVLEGTKGRVSRASAALDALLPLSVDRHLHAIEATDLPTDATDQVETEVVSPKRGAK